MELLLTSFGLSHLPRREHKNTDLFYRMPPASIGTAGQELMPDYAALLVADRLIIDSKTYDLLLRGKHNSYGNVALMVKMLHDEGFVRLEDYQVEIDQNRNVLDAMLKRDLRELDSWINPMREAVEEWRAFREKFHGNLKRDFLKSNLNDSNIANEDSDYYEGISYRMAAWIHSVSNYSVHAHLLLDRALMFSEERKKSEPRKALRDALSEYLSYVNSNIFLANKFKSGFYDWNDFRPFYKDKFMRVAQDSHPGEKETEGVKKLFEISFPEFAFWSPENIIKALKDKRISALRDLINKTISREGEFDKDFAVRTLSEVFKIERSIGKFRNFVSYLTMPLGFIPVAGTPIQKVTEESVVRPIEKKKRKNYQWFYLISELGSKS